MSPQVVHDITAARQWVLEAQRAGRTVGVVPTMGALHKGHLSLAEMSRKQCDATVVTIFVNPTQFGPGEDFDRYPRTLDADVALLAECGVDMVFAPEATALYEPGHSTYVQPGSVAGPWEGELRPDHFRGVATIVLKLFQILPAELAFFGQKDYQQTRVVRDMVRELNVGTQIEVCPIIREPDGLAMSSRNAYMTGPQRQQAVALSTALREAQRLYRDGERDAGVIQSAMQQRLTQAGIDRIDYAVLVTPDALDVVQQAEDSTMALVAAYVGKTRLIDNCRLVDDPSLVPN